MGIHTDRMAQDLEAAVPLSPRHNISSPRLVPLSARVPSRRRIRLLKQLDSWMPYRLWVPAVSFLVVFLVCITLDVPQKARRTAQFNAIMPPDFAAANLSVELLPDLLMRLLLWMLTWRSFIELT